MTVQPIEELYQQAGHPSRLADAEENFERWLINHMPDADRALPVFEYLRHAFYMGYLDGFADGRYD